MFNRFFSQFHSRFCKYLLAAVFLTLSTLTTDAVEITDPALEGAVRKALGKPTEGLTEADMASLTSLEAQELNIVNLSGLETAANLVSLNLWNNQITDISVLSGLTKLKFLWLPENQISDLSPLSGLKQLVRLWLHHNLITDIGALAGLINLRDDRVTSFKPGLRLQFNFIDVTPGSTQRQIMDDLNSIGGLTVEFDPQKDTDSDGMWDPFEQLIIDADPGDAITSLADVLPGDDFDGDGWTNLEEFNDHTNPTDPADFTFIVTIPDANLAQAIREALRKSTGEITSAEMESLTSLGATGRNIANLSGLEAAVNLERLRLWGNQISDINALSGLTRLEILLLGNNQITDVSALSGLTRLTGLSIHDNQISDISALSGITQLDYLGLENNQISDIGALITHTSLKWLWLEYNQISDLSPLSGLTQLEQLWLHKNLITDIGALAGLINLRDNSGIIFSPGLQLQYNLIDVTPGSAQRQIIDALNAIDGLSVVFEPQKDTDSDGMWDPFEQLIIDAYPGDAITTLTDVLPGDDFDGDGWTNFEEFRDRTDPIDPANFSIIVIIPDANLEQALRDALEKPTGDITDAELESLRYFSAQRDAIADLTGLETAVNLKTLRLNGNQISDLSPLSGLTRLTKLELSGNQIRDISALSGLTNLTELELFNNRIRDISALSELTILNQLHLNHNQINDISALTDLINLRDHRLFGPGLRLHNNFIDVTTGSEQRQIIDALNAIGGLRVEFEPQYLDIFQGQAIDGFPGWRASPWYLNYNVYFWPWIYHDEHGWQFVDSGSTEEVIFVWDFGIGEWLYFNENTYRWMFLFGDNPGWIFNFEKNTPNRRFFQRFDDDSIINFKYPWLAEFSGRLEDLPAPPDSLGVVRNPRYRPSDELIEDLQRRRAQAELNQSNTVPDQYIVMFHKAFFPYAVPSTSEFPAEAVSFDGETLTTVARRIVEEAGGDLYSAMSHAIKGFSARLTPGQVAAIARHPMVKFVGPEHILYPEVEQASPANSVEIPDLGKSERVREI